MSENNLLFCEFVLYLTIGGYRLMKRIILDKTNSKIIGRSLVVGENRWLALSGAGVEFAFRGRYLKVTILGSNRNGSTARLDLRVQIFREIIGNICAHSDYQPGFGGYVEVFYDRVITKNATRLIPTMKEGSLTLDELGP